ncbi:MAG: helix-turn-helix transcriptional regulator, partial [Rhodocyclaceae bacterium]|nr:helix-turn-helix transcriptional regulator [Rhodocyclaceae bacterium]
KASLCTTDYAFAKKFGLSQQVVSRWANGQVSFNDSHAAMIGEILGREPGEIMAICQAERAKDANSRSRWLRVAALVAAAMASPSHGATATDLTITGPEYRLCAFDAESKGPTSVGRSAPSSPNYNVHAIGASVSYKFQ